ncbi:MAG: hypothetical protein FWD77_01680 [Betaproteobacteria bacterium]|nr:hypothetical protein [Betaproteobacteria bacterium]
MARIEILNAAGAVENIIVADESFAEKAFPGRWRIAEASLTLEEARDARRARIKSEASERLKALDWRLERARERDTLDLPGETLAEVLAAREAVRRASSRAEGEVLALSEIADIAAFQWEVAETDRIAARQLSRFKFLQRFTPEEQATLLAAAQQNPALNAYLFNLQAATAVNLDEPATSAGVHLLEFAGLIPPGRAAEILGD